jgi:hypothetical protein
LLTSGTNFSFSFNWYLLQELLPRRSVNGYHLIIVGEGISLNR